MKRSQSLKLLKHILCFCIILLLSLQAFAEQEPTPTPPSVNLKANRYDFGEVFQGDKVSYDFQLQNTGGADLEILKIAPSCGCTAATLSSNTIAPGDSATIRVDFDTKGFVGKKVKSVSIHTNDPEKPVVILSLVGEIRSDLSIVPMQVNFGELKQGESSSREIEIFVREESPAKLHSVVTNSGAIKIETISKKPKYQKIRITISPDVKPGDLRSRVTVYTQEKIRRAKSIPVLAKIVDADKVS